MGNTVSEQEMFSLNPSVPANQKSMPKKKERLNPSPYSKKKSNQNVNHIQNFNQNQQVCDFPYQNMNLNHELYNKNTTMMNTIPESYQPKNFNQIPEPYKESNMQNANQIQKNYNQNNIPDYQIEQRNQNINKQKEMVVCQKIVNPLIDYKTRLNLTHPNLLRNYGIKQPVETGLDSPCIYFEYQEFNLKKVIEERKPNKLFAENDLKTLILNMVDVLAFLQENGISHGDIEPSTVFFDVKAASFKIYDQEIVAGGNSGFILTKLGKKQSLLAPELLMGFRYYPKIVYLEGNYFKSDVFSLGLTILEMASLFYSQDLYDYKELTIDTNQIEERLDFISEFFSNELLEILRIMLDINSENRPDFLELRQIIPDILEKKYYKSENLPIDWNQCHYNEQIYGDDKPKTHMLNSPNIRVVNIDSAPQINNEYEEYIEKKNVNTFYEAYDQKVSQNRTIFSDFVAKEDLKINKNDDSLKRLKDEILNSKRLIENYEKNRNGNTNIRREPFSEVNYNENYKNNNNNNNNNNSHKVILERNKKLEERLEEVLRKSQAITKVLNK